MAARSGPASALGCGVSDSIAARARSEPMEHSRADGSGVATQLALAERLGQPAPVDVAVVAEIAVLLCDPSGQLAPA
jgi:hypothetical protein